VALDIWVSRHLAEELQRWAAEALDFFDKLGARNYSDLDRSLGLLLWDSCPRASHLVSNFLFVFWAFVVGMQAEVAPPVIQWM